MQPVSWMLPPTWVFASLRKLVAGEVVAASEVAMATGLAVVWLLVACALFTWIFRQVLRSGLIARYSAETVN